MVFSSSLFGTAEINFSILIHLLNATLFLLLMILLDCVVILL